MSPDSAHPVPSSYPETAGFRDLGPAAASGPGLINQLGVLGVLLIVQAVLELLLGLMLVGTGAMFYFVADVKKMLGPGFGAAVAAGGAFIVVIACLRLAAGVATLSGQGRMFAIVVLLFGLATVPTTYCAPTSIALAIYGLWVLVNEAVIEAYGMAQRGKSWAEVRRHFGLN